ncbi:MAG: trigger factor [Bacteroidota bacterium]
MAQIVRNDKDALNTTISLTIERKDYEAKFKSKLNEYRREAHLKGFRKGKTPLSFVKKMYGKQLFAEIMNEQIQKNLFDFIESENIKYIGQPIEAEGYQVPEIDYKFIEDYAFHFDVGLFPEFELEGVDASQIMERPTLTEVPDEKLTERIDEIRKQQGEQVSVDEPAQEMDMLVLSAQEMEDDAIKLDGVQNEFRVLLNENILPEAKAALLGKSKGDSLQFNVFEIEEKMDANMVRKYYLGLEEEGIAEEDRPAVNEVFELTISDVLRVELAEKTEEFFTKISNGEFSNEEEAKEFLSKDLKGYYESQMNALMNIELREKLLAQNVFDLPNAFMKRWLVQTTPRTAEEVEAKYEDEIKESLRWSVIVQKVTAKADIKVEEKEVIDAIKAMISGQYGLAGMGEDFLNQMVYNLLEKHPQQYEEVYQNLLNEKVYTFIRSQITIDEQPASMESLNKILEDFQAEQEAKRTAAIAETAEEE